MAGMFFPGKKMPEQMIYIEDNPQKKIIVPNNHGRSIIRLSITAQLRFTEECCPAEVHLQRVVSSVKDFRVP
jgi:GTPase Era involved in 16S rRNA processing